MEWSHYSNAIFDAFTANDGNVIVQACPGAGKTTNIMHMWSLDQTTKVYLVFNKHVQLEAQAKLPAIPGCDVLTLNGLGYRAILATFGRVALNDRKVMDIIRGNNIQRANRDNQYTLSKMVAIAKGIDIGTGFDESMYHNAVSTYDIEGYDALYDDTIRVLALSDSMTNVIDYADQLRFPVIYNCNMPEYHTVLGDEVQDFNPIQAELIAQLAAKRYILVGDSHQSIYGFRGAMNNSMSVLKDRFDCTELPLSITYRCAKHIVADAAMLYRDIEPWDNSPDGIVRYSEAEKEQYTANDIVLCRMNRPLVALAYKLLQNGTPCYVRGRDIGQGLVRLIKKQGCFTVRELVGRLQDEQDVETEKARRKEDDSAMQRIEDKYGSALLFCNRAKLNDTPEVVCNAIEALFSEGKGVCLSTVHKAKGLEANRAMLLETPLFGICQKRAKHVWQREQERNVQYVAVTRAKRELVYM